MRPRETAELPFPPAPAGDGRRGQPLLASGRMRGFHGTEFEAEAAKISSQAGRITRTVSPVAEVTGGDTCSAQELAVGIGVGVCPLDHGRSRGGGHEGAFSMV